jgi:hypothetical protein
MKITSTERRLCFAAGLAALGGWAGLSAFAGLVVNMREEPIAEELARWMPWLLPPMTIMPYWAQPICALGIVAVCVAGLYELWREECDERSAGQAPGQIDRESV